MRRKIKMGMVGGGPGAFIGNVHRMAAALDGCIELVCGAFSSDPQKSLEAGRSLFLPAERCYPDFQTMILREAGLPLGERMDFISIVTPNHMHYAPAKMALEHGFHVVCDKPLCFSMEQAYELVALVERTKLIFAVTHNYSAYPMVKEARVRVQTGVLGAIRKVLVTYPQGWLSTFLEAEDNKQASWRTDPNRSGKAGAIGDIGTHAENLVSYITGLHIDSLCADISTLVHGRQLDDDGSILLRFTSGARGVLTASQICAGEENNLRIQIYGEKAALEWHQMEPNTLLCRYLDRPTEILRTGNAGLSAQAQAHTRLPSGHPEGYLEAFANIYRNVAFAIDSTLHGTAFDAELYDFPTVYDGLAGMQFIDKAIESGKSDKKWLSFS